MGVHLKDNTTFTKCGSQLSRDLSTSNPNSLCWIALWEWCHFNRHKKTLPYKKNKNADQFAHPCRLISVFTGCLDSIIAILAIPVPIPRLLLASSAERANFSLTWLQIFDGRFSCDVAPLFLIFHKAGHSRCHVDPEADDVLNPFLPHGLCHPYKLDESTSNFRVVTLSFYYQTAHSALFAYVPFIGC